MPIARSALTLRCATILAIVVIAALGLSLGRPVQAQLEVEPPQVQEEPVVREQPHTPVPWQDARLLAEVLEHIRREYVEYISDKELIEAAIRGMMADLDPHSAFLAPREFEDMRVSTTGEYSGVGIEVSLNNGVVRVVTPIENTPAARAGVLAGDVILAVDDVLVSMDNLNDTIERMRGKAGTSVKISIARSEAPEPLQFVLERAPVQVHSVRHRQLDSGIGYVRITHFSETTTVDVQEALERLQSEQGALNGLVLDVRGNPGGVLEAAIGVADLFLDRGTIVSADGRAADARFEVEAQPGDMLDGAPIVVLVDGGSASASEIVAGALQDHRRAVLLGRQTYGKGSVQTVMRLSDGHAIKLTTSRYFTPAGTSIHGRGITPDVIVDEQQLAEQSQPEAPTAYGDVALDYELRLALDTLQQHKPDAIRQSRAQ